MRLFGTLLSAALLALVLASCNTTEALTPQTNVGGGARASSPVTQAEADRMASSAQPETYSGGYRSGPQNTLEAQARANGLTIRPSSDSSTEHILKGYFSAFSDSGKVTIVYVWDILDGSGARLHRMQGQESVPGSGQDPWTSVPASTMETIAAKTIQDYVAWRQSQG
jgi:hypothetical protein